MRKNANTPRVQESDYISAEFGPPQDTDTFDKTTPLAEDRAQRPLPPRTSSAPADPGWLERSPTTSRPQAPTKLVLPKRALQITGIVSGLGIVISLFAGVYFFANPITNPKTVAETQETTPRTQEWEGIQVKKALK